MDDVFPGQRVVVQGVWRVAEHFVPAAVAVDEAGVGIPVPDAVADQLHDGVQHAFVHVRDIELQGLDTRCLSHRCSP
ncbi:hypothetical protein D3C75_1165840 [compost metagenome]